MEVVSYIIILNYLRFLILCKEKRVHDLRLTVDEPEDYGNQN